jgi:tetratricopeptide (TPR) repeat protein
LWRHRLADKRVLVVLDDAADHEQVEPLLPSAPGSLVMVTSRRRLSALPGALLTLDTLPPDHAAQLFRRLVRDHVRDADAAAVAQLVSLCGHLPLAIQLLAGRLRSHPVWNVRDLTSALMEAQDQLSHIRAENLAVRGAFELSYRNLSTDQQRLFRRLGLHPGRDFDTYAAAALDCADLHRMDRDLEALYADHLIEELHPGRYRLHDLIRTYARTLAREEEEVEEVEEEDVASGHAALGRLLEYYTNATAIATRHIRRYSGLDPSPTNKAVLHFPDLSTRLRALRWLNAERANLVACLDHAAMRASYAYVTVLAHRMHSFLRLAGHWDQARVVAEVACTTARMADDPRGQAFALTDLADVQRLSGRYAEAAGFLVEALSIHGELGDHLGRANALTDLGAVRYSTGDYKAAAESLQEALALYHDLGDRLGQANALSSLGVVRYLTCDYRAATESLIDALAIYRELGDQLGQANALNYLTAVQRVTGTAPTAEEALAEALALYRDLDDRLGEANALGNLAIAQYSTGKHSQAIASLSEAVSIFEDLGSPGGLANALNELGTVQCRTGEYDAARASLTTAVSLYRKLDVKIGEADALGNLGDLLRLTGDHAAAAVSLSEALTLFRGLSDRRGEADVLTKLGALRSACGNPVDAVELCRTARRLARDVRAPLEEARALEGIGRALLMAGRAEDARTSMQEALEIYRRLAAPEAEDVIATLQDMHRPAE